MFEELTSFKKSVSTLADKPIFNSYTEAKASFDAAPEELRVAFNNLVKSLKKIDDGDSAADNIGVTPITGITGNKLQTVLENLVTSGSNANGSYTKFPDGTMICCGTVAALSGTGLKTIGTITFPISFVGSTPYVTVTHRSAAGKFADFYVLDPKITDFGLVHQGNADLNGTIFTWQAVGKWK